MVLVKRRETAVPPPKLSIRKVASLQPAPMYPAPLYVASERVSTRDPFRYHEMTEPTTDIPIWPPAETEVEVTVAPNCVSAALSLL